LTVAGDKHELLLNKLTSGVVFNIQFYKWAQQAKALHYTKLERLAKDNNQAHP
jgi:hypothetical protein